MFSELLRDDVFRLETRRLWLRWPRAADAAEIARLVGDPEVACPTARIPHPYPPDAAEAFVIEARRDNAAGVAASYVLASKRRPDVPLGGIGFQQSDGDRLVLGYWLGKPHWGQGLMTESVRAMVDLAFTWTEAREIIAAVQVTNSASQGVLGKTGFRFVGEGLEEAPARSGPSLAKRFALRREEWRGLFDAQPSDGRLALH